MMWALEDPAVSVTYAYVHRFTAERTQDHRNDGGLSAENLEAVVPPPRQVK